MKISRAVHSLSKFLLLILKSSLRARRGGGAGELGLQVAHVERQVRMRLVGLGVVVVVVVVVLVLMLLLLTAPCLAALQHGAVVF